MGGEGEVIMNLRDVSRVSGGLGRIGVAAAATLGGLVLVVVLSALAM